MSPYFFLILYDKEQQSYSLPVILTYLIFVITTFRDVFKVYNFFFYLRISEKNPWKMWHNRSSLLGTFQITIWNFLNSELQETHFHAFYPHASLYVMMNYFKLHYFNLFLRLFYCIISSFLYFRMISEQNLWQIHVDGAHSHSGLRFVVWNLAGCGLLRGILSSILLIVINLSRDRFY